MWVIKRKMKVSFPIFFGIKSTPHGVTWRALPTVCISSLVSDPFLKCTLCCTHAELRQPFCFPSPFIFLASIYWAQALCHCPLRAQWCREPRGLWCSVLGAAERCAERGHGSTLHRGQSWASKVHWEKKGHNAESVQAEGVEMCESSSVNRAGEGGPGGWGWSKPLQGFKQGSDKTGFVL